MAALNRTNRIKARVIVGVLGIWIAVAVGTALWPKFPSGNCPDTPPDTAYVCRVAFGQDFEKASRRRNVLIVLEIGVILSVGSGLWLLSDRPIRRRRPALSTGQAGGRSVTGSTRGAGDQVRVAEQVPQEPAAVSPAPPAEAPNSGRDRKAAKARRKEERAKSKAEKKAEKARTQKQAKPASDKTQPDSGSGTAEAR